MTKVILQILLQLPFLLWLMFWGLFVLLPFNKYGYSEAFIPDPSSGIYVLDCDTDGETFALLSMLIIWLTAALSLGLSAIMKFWRTFKALWLMNTAAVIFSLWAIVRYHELLEYSEQLQSRCI